MLWIGHPWLSFRYRDSRLILSAPHESDEPEERWSVCPEELGAAVGRAEAEIEQLQPRIHKLLWEMGFRGDAGAFARRLLGDRG